MKPTIKEMQERIYCEMSETNGEINWVSFYDTEEELHLMIVLIVGLC